ncbi:hypothetical protein C8F01DRAFT_1334213 [Mycena amicta]|nr:hypothetical protein C8F01DRAFT_1334213 [Mycena amicta]
MSLEQARQTLLLNQRHQYALAAHAQRLEEELAEIDKLLPQADIPDDEEDLDCDFYIPDSAPPVWPVRNFLHPDSPFFEDATKRTRYLNLTTRHPISSSKEIDALKAAVNLELKRVEQLAGTSSSTTTVDNINWVTVAEKVSDSSNVVRTAMECKIKWLGELSVDVRRGPWTSLELASLEAILKKIPDKSKVNWVQVAKDLGTNRLPIDCLRQGMERPHFSWTDEMDQRLVDAVGRYGQCWALVARYVSPGLAAAQCSSHWYRALDPTLRSGTWSAEEDKRLQAAVNGFGKSWVEVASAIPGRNNEQCRERWMAKFEKPGNWSEEDDKKLTEAVAVLGKKWKEIGIKLGRPSRQASLLPHACSNYNPPQCQLREKYLQSQNLNSRQSSPLSCPPDDIEEAELIDLPPADESSTARQQPKPARGGKKKVAPAAEPGQDAEDTPPTRPKPKPRGTKRAAVTPEPDEQSKRAKVAGHDTAPSTAESANLPPRRRSARLNK